MSKDYDADNRYILEDKSFVDTKTNQCLNFGLKDLSRVAIQLNCMEGDLNDADNQIAELQKQLKEKEKMLEEYKKCNCEECMTDYEKNLNQIIDKYLYENNSLKQQLKSQPAEIVEKIKKRIKDNMICFWKDEDRKSFNRILKSILKEYQK